MNWFYKFTISDSLNYTIDQISVMALECVREELDFELQNGCIDVPSPHKVRIYLDKALPYEKGIKYYFTAQKE